MGKKKSKLISVKSIIMCYNLHSTMSLKVHYNDIAVQRYYAIKYQTQTEIICYLSLLNYGKSFLVS